MREMTQRPAGWRRLGGLVAVAAVITTAGCSSEETAGTASTRSGTGGGSTASPGTYGQPADPSAADPTNVATDAPVSPSAGASDGEAPVRLTYSGYDSASSAVEVDGYVVGIAETDGKCTLTLSKDGKTVTATVSGTENVHDTDCGGAAVPRDQLSPGTWTARLSYDSSSTHGSSDPVKVTVP